MASASKLLPPQIAELECRHILHPWTESCFLAYLRMYAFSCFGSAGYFALFYSFQYIVRMLKKKKQLSPKDLLWTYVKSCLFFSPIVSSSYTGFSCFFRKILGKFYFYSIVFAPALLAGLAISSEIPRNKDLFSTAFANMALESCIRKNEYIGPLNWSLNTRTFVFMILTSSLSYLYKEVSNENKYFWFFIPPKSDSTEEKDSSCFHKDTCLKSTLTCFTKYFTTGFLLKLLKLLFSNFRRPSAIFLSLLKLKTYSFAAFLGLYAFIYHGTRCLFHRRWKRCEPFHDLVSGFLSGAAYKFDPNISVFNSAVITIFQILLDNGSRKKILPNLPYNVFLFALSCGILFHVRFYTPHYCPPLMHYIMSSVTNNGSDQIAGNYRKLMNNM